MAHNKDKVMIAIKKANTLQRKILTMLEDDKYCIDIIQQNLAVIGLIKSANLLLLQGHINHCVKNAAKEKSPKKLDNMMAELIRVMELSQKK